MITSKEINSYTEEIWKEYQEMTGVKTAPDLSEFLMLRNQSLKEIGQGIVFGGDAPLETITTVIPERISQPVVEKVSEVKPVPVMETPVQTSIQHVAPAAPVIESVPVKIPEAPVRKEDPKPAEKPKKPSAFDILRGVKDPWN